MRVLVTGGTGFIGRRLVRALAERGDAAVVLTRDPEEARGVLGDAVELAAWTAQDAWHAAVAAAEAVVHLAGAGVADRRWSPERLALIRSSRIETTGALARAIARAAHKPSVFVSGSAVGYYGMREDDAVLDEGAPPGDDELARIVVDWEAAASPAREAGVRVAHPRTGIVLGMEAGVLAKMLGPFRAFVGGPIGTGRQWVSWVDVRDAVGALLFAIDTPALQGPFNLSAPNPVTMNELARVLGATLGRPSAFRVPAPVLKVALGAGLARAVLTGQRAVPQKLETAGYRFRFPTLDASLKDLLGRAPGG